MLDRFLRTRHVLLAILRYAILRSVCCVFPVCHVCPTSLITCLLPIFPSLRSRPLFASLLSASNVADSVVRKPVKISTYLIVPVSAFTRGGWSRHHQLSWPHLGRRHSRLDGPVRAHYRLSPSPFSIVRGRRLAVRRAVPGRP